MPASKYPARSAVEWDASFDLFHASGLTQKAFCEQHGLSRDAFRNRYRTSAKFAGTRRRPGTASSDAKDGAFRTVRPVTPSPTGMSSAAASVVVRLPGDLAVECRVGSDPVAVATLVRELLR